MFKEISVHIYRNVSNLQVSKANTSQGVLVDISKQNTGQGVVLDYHRPCRACCDHLARTHHWTPCRWHPVQAYARQLLRLDTVKATRGAVSGEHGKQGELP